MTNLDRARSILKAWQAQPAPLGGRIDRDESLVMLIASEFDQQTETVEAVDSQRADTDEELANARAKIDALLEKKSRTEAAFLALADRLDGLTFGAGIATETDLTQIAGEVRTILRTT